MTDDEAARIESGWPDNDPDRMRLFPHWRASQDEAGYVWERVDSCLIDRTYDNADMVNMHLSDVALLLTVIRDLRAVRAEHFALCEHVRAVGLAGAGNEHDMLDELEREIERLRSVVRR